MINLEIPEKFKPLVGQANQVATEVFRPISRRYDTAEHTYPKELDMLAAVIDGMNEGGEIGGSGAAGVGGAGRNGRRGEPQRLQPLDRARDHRALLGGRRPAALDAAPGTRQLGDRLGGERGAAGALRRALGGDGDHRARSRLGLAAIRTTAELDGDEYVLNGEKIFVTAGDRADLIVVWATLDRSLGRAAIKTFIVERDNPGLKLDRLEQKLGIRASDTANFTLKDCRVPKEKLLGSPKSRTKQGFGGRMQTFDNTRPLVAAMAVGVARASLERPARSWQGRAWRSTTRCAGALPARRGGASSWRWRPTTRRRGCSPCRRPGWPTTRGPTHCRPRWRRRRPAAPASRWRSAASTLRQRRLWRERAAGEVGARREDPRHLRGHPTDPAANRGAPAAGQELSAAEVGRAGRSPARGPRGSVSVPLDSPS